jgi:hypothetical protein
MARRWGREFERKMERVDLQMNDCLVAEAVAEARNSP